MKLNIHILADELSSLLYDTVVDRSARLTLSAFKLMDRTTDTAPDKSYVYITTASEIKKNSESIKDLNLILIGPPEEAECVDGLGCNVLYISSEYNLVTVINHVQDVFTKYHLWEECLLEACVQQRTLQEIFDIIAEAFPNPLVVCDYTSTIVLTAGKVPDPPIGFWKYLLPHGYYVLEEHMRNNPSFNFSGTITQEKPVWATAKDLDYPLILFNLLLNGVRFGDITLTETEAPLTMGQYSLMCYIQEIIKKHFEAVGMQRLKETDSMIMVHRLLKGETVTDFSIQSELNRLGWKSDDPFYLIKIALSENQIAEKTESGYFVNVLSRELPDGFIMEFDHSIIAILRIRDYPYPDIKAGNQKHSKRSASADKNKVLTTLAKLSKQLYIQCGISQLFYNFRDLLISYKQSSLALRFSNNQKPKEPYCYYFYDCYFNSLKSYLCDSVDYRVFCDPRVLKLKQYDDANHTELLETLMAVLVCGMKMQEVSEILHIHRNTLTYRLNRIRELINLNLESIDRIDQLLLSCLLIYNAT